MDTHCQICGRLIQAKTGRIAHHGYRRPGQGWQTASCFGAKYRPYEVACDALPKAIEGITQHIERVEEALADHLANPPRGLTYTPHTMNRWDERPRSVLRPEGFTSGTPNGYDRPGTYPALYQRRKFEMEHDIETSQAAREEFRRRLADWKAP